jgi:hypothetical protein
MHLKRRFSPIFFVSLLPDRTKVVHAADFPHHAGA